MKPSTELFKLIQSLSKSEKRFFKLSSSLQSGEKNYLKIFDFIEKQEDYDEEELKEYFKDETFIKHLPSEKNHLYKLILKSLRSYYSDQSINSLLKQEIKNIEILYKKALYKECEKFLKRAKKIAEEYEKFYYWFELISWEKKLLEEAFEAGKFDRDLDALIEEESDVIDKLRNLAEYQVLYSKINYIFRSGGFTRNAEERKVVSDIANHHLIKGKNTALSSRAASICYYIKGLCAATSREYTDSYKFFNRTKYILDHNPKIKKDLGKRYIFTLSHLLRCHMDENDFESAQKCLDEISALKKDKNFKNIDFEVRLFTITCNEQLHLFNHMGQFEKAKDLVPEINAGVEKYGDKVNKEQQLLFSFNLAYTYFGLADYKTALSYINDVLNDNEQNLRQDIYSFSRLLNLIIHYELGNLDFLEYVVKSTNRYLNKTERDHKIENVFVKQVKQLAKAGDKENEQKILEDMAAETRELMKDYDERVALEYVDIEAWLDAKLNNISFTEAVVAKLK
ncbi:hypothetical protein [Lishizhenia sp.]|uniref:hypothetical protein n=1 Tax=Lishizhenia sp. TaxID=2497594 RepID=UPI00299DED59|nr:hypothetical protein [Lishizhenia sp.]MDX1445758.1 hypothetical protein [Lishizhenia sp.]